MALVHIGQEAANLYLIQKAILKLIFLMRWDCVKIKEADLLTKAEIMKEIVKIIQNGRKFFETRIHKTERRYVLWEIIGIFGCFQS